MRALILGALVGTLIFLGAYYWPTSTLPVPLSPCDQACIDDLNEFIFKPEPKPESPRKETPVRLHEIGG